MTLFDGVFLVYPACAGWLGSVRGDVIHWDDDSQAPICLLSSSATCAGCFKLTKASAASTVHHHGATIFGFIPIMGIR